MPKRKTASSDDVTGTPAVIRKSTQAMSKGELIHQINNMKAAMLRMTDFMESVAEDAKKTRQLVQQLHKWDSLRPHASNFNRVLADEQEKAEVRRREREDGQV